MWAGDGGCDTSHLMMKTDASEQWNSSDLEGHRKAFYLDKMQRRSVCWREY